MNKEVDSADLKFTGERLIPKLNKGYAFFYEHLSRYLFSTQFVKGKVVLDAGCGTGYGSNILASLGKAEKVLGIDLSPEAIKYANHYYGGANISFKEDSVETMKTVKDNSIDVVISFELIEHIENQEAFLNQIKRVLKREGIFIVSTPNKYNYPEGNVFHVHELYPEEFQKNLATYFKNTQLLLQDFDFAQMIKRLDSAKIKIEEDFVLESTQTYQAPTSIKDAQYVMCICSNSKIPEYSLVSVTSNQVDNFDLTKGMLSLNDQNTNLHRDIAKLSKMAKDNENYVFMLKDEVEKRELIIKDLQIQLEEIRSKTIFRVANALNHPKLTLNAVMSHVNPKKRKN